MGNAGNNEFLTAEQRTLVRRRLLAWYAGHRRDLPWRRDRDPYRIWVSEIMLQQTRVGAVVGHYHRFLKRFPTVSSLAASREASVLAAWTGLGYYRRARMLHAAARMIVRDYGGRFPFTPGALRTLPGIGRYTAAAVSSIAFDQPIAAVDGNVERVLQRLTGLHLSHEQLWQAAQDLLNRKRPGEFNQAMMELGATVCVPRVPDCPACPLARPCSTFAGADSHPTLAAAFQRAKISRRAKKQVGYGLAYRNRAVFLMQRAHDAAVMPGRWELPETAISTTDKVLFTVRHSITTTDYVVQVLRVKEPASPDGVWVRNQRLNTLPLTGLTQKILRKAAIIQ